MDASKSAPSDLASSVEPRNLQSAPALLSVFICVHLWFQPLPGLPGYAFYWVSAASVELIYRKRGQIAPVECSAFSEHLSSGSGETCFEDQEPSSPPAEISSAAMETCCDPEEQSSRRDENSRRKQENSSGRYEQSSAADETSSRLAKIFSSGECAFSASLRLCVRSCFRKEE